MTADIVIAADGGHASGLGHLSRAGALATALRVRGWNVVTVVVGAHERIRHDVEWTPVVSLAASPKPRPGGAMVVDSYVECAEDLRYIAPAAALILLNDRSAGASGADLVVSLAAKPAPGVLAGPRYACLRPAYWGVDPDAAADGPVASMLVTAGATAAPIDIASAIAERFPGVAVRLVVGPYARASVAAGIEQVVAPRSLLDLLCGADVVVTAAGQTLLEALACGRPTVSVVTTENQRAQAALAADAGAALLVSSPDATVIGDRVAELVADDRARSRLAAAGPAFVDGFGALRVAFAVERLLARRL